MRDYVMSKFRAFMWGYNFFRLYGSTRYVCIRKAMRFMLGKQCSLKPTELNVKSQPQHEQSDSIDNNQLPS